MSMNNVAKNHNGTGDGFLDAAVLIAAGGLFFKTADVLSFFAPEWLNIVFGMDVSFFYGATVAILIEGMALSLHFSRRARNYPPANRVKWITLFLSGLCQVFDGFISTNSVDAMSDPLRFALSYGVPLLPLAIMLMIFGIGRLPEENEYVPTIWDRGLKSYVPNFRQLWDGRGVPAQTQAHASFPSPTPTLPQDDPELNRVLEDAVSRVLARSNGQQQGGGSNFQNHP